MELGVFSFGDRARDPRTGTPVPVRERLRQVIEQIRFADEVGIDFFGLGERHRQDFAISTPTTMLAAAASVTSRIKLTSAVTVLSAEDPVRVYQQFATIDQLTGGRAEIIAGRGSFVEAFALFGAPIGDYDALFDEKLAMLRRIDAGNPVTWSGRFHAPLNGVEVLPRAHGTSEAPGRLRIWVGTGGNPRSAAVTGALGLPIIYGIIGGGVARFRPLVDLYRHSGAQAGHDPASLKVGISAAGLILDDGDAARKALFPHYMDVVSQVSRERGSTAPDRAFYDHSAAPDGSLFVGSPDEVVDKIRAVHEIFGNTRIGMQLDFGGLDPALTKRSIELLVTEVLPRVRELTTPTTTPEPTTIEGAHL